MAVKKTVHTAEEIRSVLEELKKQTDRGAGIIAASVTEELLAVVIQERLLPLNSDLRQALFERMNAPLSTMSAKINLGRALGLYSDVGAKRLHMLREVRNRFAHRIEALTFDHPIVVDAMQDGLADVPPPKFKSNRFAFEMIFAACCMLLLGQSGQNIRINNLGETRPEIFLQLLSVLDPAMAEKISALGLEPKPDPTGK